MSDEVKVLNEKEAATAAGGRGDGVWADRGAAPHARGMAWAEGNMVMYSIAGDDYLGNIAQRFGTSPYAIQSLNPAKIKNIDLIRVGDTIRVL